MKVKQAAQLNWLTEKERLVASRFVEKVSERFASQLISVVLFGSRARGQAAPDSDMDVLVVLSGADLKIRQEIRYLAVEVWLEHGIYLSTRVWSESHWHKVAESRTLLYQNVCRDGIDLLKLFSITPRKTTPSPPLGESGEF
jgi:predicted nucleotidyltransferase